MLDINAQHPFSACVAFALRLLESLSRYDLAAVEEMIDVNESGAPLGQSFIPPEGFTYGVPENAKYWAVHFFGQRSGGYGFECSVPFVEPEYTEMTAVFDVNRVGDGSVSTLPDWHKA
jgi:hypothetical protein